MAGTQILKPSPKPNPEPKPKFDVSDKAASSLKAFIPWTVWGCLVPSGSVLVISIALALFLHFHRPQIQPPGFVKDAAPTVEKREQALASAKAASADYDIDSTVSSLFAMEQSLAKAKSFEEITNYITQRDSALVAPEVLALKYRFFDIYSRLLQSEDELKDMNSMYGTVGGALLDMASISDIKTMSLSREQAQKVWSSRFEATKARREYKRRLEKAQDEMIPLLADYNAARSKYHAEWDRLCSARDRAYLAVYEGKWDEAIANAAAASKIAPHEKEAHMLLAMALLERGTETDLSGARAAVEGYIKEHPADAAGFLLRGVMDMKDKKYDQAVVDFDQAAAYFPKMQDEMNDRLNIYRTRQFLNKSKEGRVIVNMYRAFMSGSGYFSPDFQKARIYLAQGRTDEARAKIFDHFFRRRQQGEWDKVLADFHYCNQFLGTELFRIGNGKEKGSDKLEIAIDSAIFSNSIVLTLENKGKSDLHNVSALLCVRFTDMFKGDYISFPVGETVSLLKAGQSVKVGRKNISELTEDRFGTPKKFKDIIEYAAVIISDELITWVDAKQVDALMQETPGDIMNQPIGWKDIPSTVKKAMGRTLDTVENELVKERHPDQPAK